MLSLLFNIFISRLLLCKVSVNVLQVEMIGLSNAMNRSWIWNVSSLFWCVSFPRTPFPHRYSDGQGSLFRGELIINVAWPRKRQENSKLISFCILQRVFSSTSRKGVRWRQRVRSHLAFYVSSCPNNEDRGRRGFFFLFNQRSKQAIKCLKAF